MFLRPHPFTLRQIVVCVFFASCAPAVHFFFLPFPPQFPALNSWACELTTHSCLSPRVSPPRTFHHPTPPRSFRPSGFGTLQPLFARACSSNSRPIFRRFFRHHRSHGPPVPCFSLAVRTRLSFDIMSVPTPQARRSSFVYGVFLLYQFPRL